MYTLVYTLGTCTPGLHVPTIHVGYTQVTTECCTVSSQTDDRPRALIIHSAFNNLPSYLDLYKHHIPTR